MKKFINFLYKRKQNIIWVGLFSIFFIFSQQWQTRNLLQHRQYAPSLKLHAVDGKEYSLESFRGKTVLLYFFAPWCSICKITTGNIEILRKYNEYTNEQNLQILTVGLAYNDAKEIAEFQKSHDIHSPVLIGNEVLADAYKITGFPTFYVIDAEGKIKTSTIGYTSAFGLLWRTI